MMRTMAAFMMLVNTDNMAFNVMPSGQSGMGRPSYQARTATMLANEARAIPPLTISKDQLEPRNLALGDLKKIRSRIENGRRVLGELKKEVSLLMGAEEN